MNIEHSTQDDRGQVGRRASQKTFVRALITVGVLCAGVVTVRGLERALDATFDKPPAPLTKPLDEMPRNLGDPVHYSAVGHDEILSPEIIETLGTSQYLVREYQNILLPQDQPGAFVNLNVNYYATGSSTPHVPEVCWAGSGRIEAPGSRQIFDVNGVPRKDGSSVNLRVRLISFLPDAKDATADPAGEPVYANVAYVFQVNGVYVATTQEVTSHFWKASNKFAYHAKIEVTPMKHLTVNGSEYDVPLVCTRNQAIAIVSDFLKSTVAPVEECLPDPAILSAAPAGPVASGNTR